VFGEYGVAGLPEIPPLPSHETAIAVAGPLGAVFSIELAEQITNEYYTQIIASVVDGPSMMPNRSQPLPPSKHTLLKGRSSTITSSIAKYNSERQTIDARVLGTVAACIVQLDGCMPAKISPVVRSLMDAIQYEAHETFQSRVAEGIAMLIRYNVTTKPAANIKIIAKLDGFLCCDLAEAGDCVKMTEGEGILTLSQIQKAEVETKGKGRPSKKDLGKLGSDAADIIDSADVVDEDTKNALDLCRRGAGMAFKEIFALFASTAFESCPKLEEVLFSNLVKAGDAVDSQTLVNTMFTLSTCASFVDEGLHGKLEDILKPVCLTLKNPLAVVRTSGAKCIASLTKVVTVPAMQVIVDSLLPLLSDSRNLIHRQGASEAVYHIIGYLDDSILPYIIFLIVPILGRMSDPDEGVRFLSTHIFAQLIKLVPLESGVPDPVGISQELIDQRNEERKFLGQLVGSEKVEDFELCVDIKAELRSYQKEGVSWLAFLNRFGLHGILCDGLC
jgi:TATA-binding protein-associated factor